MLFVLDCRYVKYFAKVLNVFSRFGDDIRLRSTSDGLVVEAIKDDLAYGYVRSKRAFFDQFDPRDPIDKRFKSKSICHVFRNPSGLAKNLISLTFEVSSDSNFARIEQEMRRFKRRVFIPENTLARNLSIQLSDYLNYPCIFEAQCKMLFNSLKEIPNSSGLASFRIRDDGVRIETGESELEAEIYSHLTLFPDELFDYKPGKVNVTINVRPLKAFLSAWDPKTHSVRCHFSEESHQVFEITDVTNMIAILAVVNIVKEYRPDSPDNANDSSALNTSAMQSVLNTSAIPAVDHAAPAVIDESLRTSTQTIQRPPERTHILNSPSDAGRIIEASSNSAAPGSIDRENFSSLVSEDAEPVQDANRPVQPTQTLGTVQTSPSTQVIRSNITSTSNFDSNFYRKETYQSALRQLKLMGLIVGPSNDHSNEDNNEDSSREKEKQKDWSDFEFSEPEEFYD